MNVGCPGSYSFSCLSVSLALSTLRTPAACAQRYRSSLDPAIKKGDWTLSEDERLKEAVTIYGGQWSKISSLMKGRTGPQCRERYMRRTALAGTKAGKWTDEVRSHRTGGGLNLIF